METLISVNRAILNLTEGDHRVDTDVDVVIPRIIAALQGPSELRTALAFFVSREPLPKGA